MYYNSKQVGRSYANNKPRKVLNEIPLPLHMLFT